MSCLHILVIVATTISCINNAFSFPIYQYNPMYYYGPGFNGPPNSMKNVPIYSDTPPNEIIRRAQIGALLPVSSTLRNTEGEEEEEAIDGRRTFGVIMPLFDVANQAMNLGMEGARIIAGGLMQDLGLESAVRNPSVLTVRQENELRLQAERDQVRLERERNELAQLRNQLTISQLQIEAAKSNTQAQGQISSLQSEVQKTEQQRQQEQLQRLQTQQRLESEVRIRERERGALVGQLKDLAAESELERERLRHQMEVGNVVSAQNEMHMQRTIDHVVSGAQQQQANNDFRAMGWGGPQPAVAVPVAVPVPVGVSAAHPGPVGIPAAYPGPVGVPAVGVPAPYPGMPMYHH